MPKHVYAVSYQVEIIRSKIEQGKPVVVGRGHGGEFTESVIASCPERACAYVRDKHTSDGKRVLRASAHLLLSNLDAIPDAEPETESKKNDGEDSALDVE